MSIFLKKTLLIFLIFTIVIACKKSFEPISSLSGVPKILYLSRVDSTYLYDLKTINYDGSNKTKLVQIEFSDFWYNSPCFSPDGNNIVYSLNNDIFLVTVDGKKLTQLTFNDRDNVSPHFLLQNSKIIFSSSKSITINQGTREIYSIDINGENEISLSGKIASDIRPIPSLDGSKISFISKRTGQWELWIMDNDGQNQINLTNSPFQEWNQQFSPDGNNIIFEGRVNDQREIFIVDSDGGNRMQLTNNLGNASNAKFSPDGTKIIFNAAKDGFSKLYLMDIETKELTYLENNIEGNRIWDEHPQFSEDGKVIFFQSNIDDSFDICKMNIDATGQINITNDRFSNEYPIVYP